MITTPEEYNASIIPAKNPNYTQLAVLLPSTETIYEINLNERTIQAPKVLGVRKDYASETVYFIVDRYYDNEDLANTVCKISYYNDGYKPTDDEEENKGGYYQVPFYDINTYPGKILIPWIVGGGPTIAAGNLTFSFTFFRIDIANPSNYIYSLSTQPASTKILNGLNMDELDSMKYPVTETDQLRAQIDTLSRQIKGVYWTDI